jgi:hypothetical protein
VQRFTRFLVEFVFPALARGGNNNRYYLMMDNLKAHTTSVCTGCLFAAPLCFADGRLLLWPVGGDYDHRAKRPHTDASAALCTHVGAC